MSNQQKVYLLDVNVLLAFGWAEHEFHQRVVRWAMTMKTVRLASCSITELGFARILAQIPASGVSVAQARQLLGRLKSTLHERHLFLADANDISALPAWAVSARQTTDGHLLQLAKTHSGQLATLDTGIPGAFIIPLHK